jgi:hypothetical protein
MESAQSWNEFTSAGKSYEGFRPKAEEAQGRLREIGKWIPVTKKKRAGFPAL